jgi:hypothetical protein
MRASTCERLVIVTGSAQPPTRHPQDRAARRRVRQRSEADDRRRATGAWVTNRTVLRRSPHCLRAAERSNTRDTRISGRQPGQSVGDGWSTFRR